jgi:hypothetical protein
MVLREPDEIIRTCTSKVRFRDKAAAKRRVKQFTRLGTPRSWYRCDYCNGYHLTSQTKEMQRTIRANIRRQEDEQG